MKLFDIQTLNADVEKIHSNIVEKIAKDLPSLGILIDIQNPNAIPIKNNVGENTIAVM
jgi:hypothetical protein